MSIADLRRDYTRAGLREEDCHADPFTQFDVWFEQAREAGALDPNAMTLATVDADGRPDARVVLLKGVSPRGFVFFTNYQSAKGRQLDHTPAAALVFFWPELERQVRITGSVSKVDRQTSVDYFESRPRASRIGAWASQQSEVVADREVLEQAYAQTQAMFEGDAVPLPDTWGGYRVSPGAVEFWQGRASRLHDRLRYRRESETDAWTLERLSP